MKPTALLFALSCLSATTIAAPVLAAPASGWIVQSGHKVDDFGEGISALQWSPDGKWLASATAVTGEMIVRNRSGQVWARESGLPRIRALDWSADSRLLALAADSNIKIWKRENAEFDYIEPSQTWMLGEGAPVNIGFLSENRLALILESAQSPHQISAWIWNFVSGEKICVARAIPGVRGFAVAPDHQSFAISSDVNLAIYGADGIVKAQFPTVKDENGSNIGVEELRYSPDGKWLAGFASNSSHWKKWNLATRKESAGAPISGYSPPKDYTLTNAGELGRRQNPLKQPLFADDVTPELFAVDAGAQREAISDVWGDVATFDRVSGANLWLGRNSNQWANAVSFSADNAQLVVGYGQRSGAGSTGDLAVFDLADSRLRLGLAAQIDSTGTDPGVTDASFSPDGKWLIANGQTSVDNRALRVWDANTLRQIRNIALRDDIRALKMAWSSDGKSLAVGADDGEVSLWKDFARAASGKINPDWTAHLLLSKTPSGSGTDREEEAMVLAVSISPDKHFVLAGSDAKNFAVLDYATGKILHRLPLASVPQGAVWAADSQRFWTAAQNGQILEWRASDFKIVRTLSKDGEYNYCGALALSSDGSTLYVGKGDNAVAFDTATGAFKRELRGVGDYFNALAVSSNGAFVAGASENGIAALWNAHTGELLRTFRRVSAVRDSKNYLKTETAAFDEHGELLARTSANAALWREDENLLDEKPAS